MVPQSPSQVSRYDAIAGLFWNHTERRVRSGWRLLLQVLLVTIPLSIAASSGAFSTADRTDTRVMVTALPVTVISLLMLGRWVDRRQFSDYGLLLGQKRWWADYGAGVVAALLSASVLVGALALLGWAEITPSSMLQGGSIHAWVAVLTSLVTYAGIGAFEEALRVYQIRNLTEGLAATKIGFAGATTIAVLFSALYSVTMHMAGGDPPFLAYILVSGALYGLFFLWTRRSALAMAYHFAWDFAISTLFLLGASATTGEPAFFLVLLDGVPDRAQSALLPLLGIVAKGVGLLAVALWVRWREGQVRVREDLAVPSLR